MTLHIIIIIREGETQVKKTQVKTQSPPPPDKL